MKNIPIRSNILSSILFVIAISLVSCEYKEYAEADYPDQLIYMPAAKNGNFVIDNVNLPIGSVPTSGNTYRYVVDTVNRKFNIPLAVYRSGINNNGGFKVDISVNTDTITKLIAVTGKLPVGTVILASDKYSIGTSVDIIDGEETGSFDLSIDLDFLLNSYPGGIYAIGIGVSSTSRKSNPLLSTTIIVINTKMMKPTAGFSFTVPADIKTRNFNNTSIMAVSYKWNFGDGTAISFEKSPIHTYAAAGVYTVTLTAFGESGFQNKSVTTTSITVL